MRLTARVPATSANLGSGFDCLGLALDFYNEFVVDTACPAEIVVEGEGAQVLPRNERNLVYRTMRDFFEDLKRPLPSFRLEARNHIPLTGGLGGSSTALVGALLLANALADEPFDRWALLERAARLEKHPDNVAPAMLGGFVVAALEENRLHAVRLAAPNGLRAVLFIPSFSIPTREARRLLPTNVPLRDAVFNVSRAALWVAALQTDRLDLLHVAAEDRLHQPYRVALFPSMPQFFDAARKAGALAAWLSGAGSALLALTRGGEDAVADAFRQTASTHGVDGRVRIVDICREGATVRDSVLS